MDRITNNTSAVSSISRNLQARAKEIFRFARIRREEHVNLPNDEQVEIGEITKQNARQPEPVVFDSFSAECEERRVMLRWHTRQEIDLLGFDVYQADDESGENIRVNTRLIVAQGNALEGEWYSLVDEIDGHDLNFYYTLGAIDFRGKLLFTDRHKVTLSPPPFKDNHGQYNTPSCNMPAEVFYSVKARGNVGIQLYNVAGRLVKNLYDGYAQKGTYRLRWDGTDEKGEALTNGVYFLKTNMSEYIATRKIVLIDTVLSENRMSRVLCERDKQWKDSESAACIQRGEALQ